MSGLLLNISKKAYGFVFQRTSTTAVAIVGMVFVFGRIFDPLLDNTYYGLNKGVSFPFVNTSNFRRNNLPIFPP